MNSTYAADAAARHELTANEYQRDAERTMNNETPADERLVNAALGLAGEAGEVCDLVKKWRHHGHPLRYEKLIDELGDLQWYIVQACNALGASLEDVMRGNTQKLQKRYPEGFSSAASINRKDT